MGTCEVEELYVSDVVELDFDSMPFEPDPQQDYALCNLLHGNEWYDEDETTAEILKL